jgi:hypothetical protein
MGALVTCMACPFDRVNEVTAQHTSGGDYRRTRCGGLGEPRAPKHLRGSLPAPSGHDADPLFDPYGDPPNPTAVHDRHGRQRKKRCHGRALERPPTHFTTQAAVDHPTRDTGAHVGLRQAHLPLARFAGGVGGDGSGPELTHAPGRIDGSDAIELGTGAASSGACLAQPKPQQAGSRHRADAAACDHGHDLALARIKIGHQVRGTGEPVHQLQSLEGVVGDRRLLGRGVEPDAPPRAKAGEVPSFAMPAAAVIDRQPERTQQVVFVGDAARSHYHSGDRVVHDFFLRACGDAATLAAASQLSNQRVATPV